MKERVKFKKLSERATIPTRGSSGAAGLDLYASENYVLEPGAYGLVKTDIAMELPVGWEAQVRPRSGLAFKHGITVLNGPGTIDDDYRGEVGAILFNASDKLYQIMEGDRIAQLVVAPAYLNQVDLVEVSEFLTDTERGEGGFGSTGK